MAGSPSPFSASDQPPASASLRSMSPPLGGGGAGSGGAGASSGVGVAKKGRGGGTPTRSKSNRNRTFGLASVVAQEEEVSNGGADGWKASHAGRKAGVRGGAAAAAAGSKQVCLIGVVVGQWLWACSAQLAPLWCCLLVFAICIFQVDEHEISEAKYLKLPPFPPLVRGAAMTQEAFFSSLLWVFVLRSSRWRCCCCCGGGGGGGGI